eukprot:TRINITY_DN1034_c0_g5_i3.p2 TRINITY_DN1034_c0_g5~~TRINITY_DN1034_c0_g5_i3.p2  ORF type:complete len:108 (-),score=8.18 TRINITY_DN1034_c0_g5_i3:268-591(-)
MEKCRVYEDMNVIKYIVISCGQPYKLAWIKINAWRSSEANCKRLTTPSLCVMYIKDIVGAESADLVEALLRDMMEIMEGFKAVKEHNDKVYESLVKEQEEVKAASHP